MQNKGFVKVIAVLLSLICIFYLSFSFVTSHHEKKAAAMGEVAGRAYLDSLRQSEESVWLGYDYKHCEALQIGLGLDLKGGMNVILEVSVPDVVKNLAGTGINEPKVKQVFDEARAEVATTGENFLDVFVSKYQAQVGKNQLGGLFALKLKDAGITPNSNDAEVKTALETEVKAAVSNSYQVVRQRIDRFGVAQPNIQILEGRGQMGQIMVEMPGIKEPERVRKLLQGSANLEFWETYKLADVQGALSALDTRLAGNGTAATTDSTAKDTTATAPKAEEKAMASAAEALKQGAKAGAAQPEAKKAVTMATDAARIKANPLFGHFVQMGNPNYAIVGYALPSDTAAINTAVQSAAAQEILPADLHLAWSSNAEGGVYSLYALRATNGKPALAGEVIADAKDDYNQMHKPVVSMTMTPEGAREWAAITTRNVEKPVAIVLDGVVYSAPNINEPITGGQSQISGNFTVLETQDLANVLKSGKMPAPTNIVQEETVGPSLGAASIEAGFTACVVAFVLLMIMMCAYYGLIPGMVANVALILNFFFTFGVLTSFQAALTMSGLAGMVLSLGMAVDANVLIYERTKEELRNGKNLKQAIADGYGNAFSAIFDSNLTSIITAVILYNFGTGPIRGFAMTLGIGIVASFFTAVWLTRIAYEHFLERDKWLGITFVTGLSKNFLMKIKVQFMQKFGRSIVFFGILVLIGAGALAIRGLQRGIDFTGGRNYVVEFTQKVQPEEVKKAIEAEVAKTGQQATVSTLAIVTTQNPAVRISTSYKIEQNDAATDQEVEQLIWKGLKSAHLVEADYNTFKDRDNREGGSIISAQKVGPTVAADMTRGAMIAVALSLIAIFIYILFRFRSVAFSVGAVAALAVDTFIIIGLYALCWGFLPFSLEVDQTFIGAILTVIGYSINDKVVVFDRIREDLGLYPTRDIERVFNEAINSTLTRTIMTSATTLLVLLCIFFLGGDAIRSFSFAMILGVIFGTLSSIFLAAPIAFKLYGKRQNKKQAQVVQA
ncbi:MAG: protein translocase subunit SecDF [Bacteroidales bacterium]|nr:protein translocase subunit SecDF [Bacteroidales bacterium]